MKKTGYGKDYKYAHAFPGHFVQQEFLPEKISGTKIYEPQENPREKEIRNRLSAMWKNHYGYGKPKE
jgi:putative ATPase